MQVNKEATPFATLSLLSVTLTAILASISHAYEFGYRAFIAGVVLISLLCALNIFFQRTKSTVSLLFYGLVNAWIIIGFDLVNGFWNHALKVSLYYLHNGYLPPFLAKFFLTPQIGGSFYEGVGVLTFITSVFAAHFGYKLIKEGR